MKKITFLVIIIASFVFLTFVTAEETLTSKINLDNEKILEFYSVPTDLNAGEKRYGRADGVEIAQISDLIYINSENISNDKGISEQILKKIKSAIEDAKENTIIYIADNLDLFLSESIIIERNDITIASGRGNDSGKGARLRLSPQSSANAIFQIKGKRVRITGLRIHDPSDAINTCGIITTGHETEIDNCDLRGWGNAAVYLGIDSNDSAVHHNVIMDAYKSNDVSYGYGVIVKSSNAKIHSNNFSSRYPISGTDSPDTTYEAYINIAADISAEDKVFIQAQGSRVKASSGSSYYSVASGLSGSSLKSALHNIISSGVSYSSYSQCWDKLRYTDEDLYDNSKVRLLYSLWSYDKYNNGYLPDEWNREHTWPKSQGQFGENKGPGTDLHHLRATDVSINSKRSSYDFDWSGDYYYDDGINIYCKYDDSVETWQVRSASRGDVARMMFYMAVMYEGHGGYDRCNLELTESNNYGYGPTLGRLSVLKQWHAQDPVDNWEQQRNEKVYSQQGNRNPFIDNPQWVESIW